MHSLCLSRSSTSKSMRLSDSRHAALRPYKARNFTSPKARPPRRTLTRAATAVSRPEAAQEKRLDQTPNLNLFIK